MLRGSLRGSESLQKDHLFSRPYPSLDVALRNRRSIPVHLVATLTRIEDPHRRCYSRIPSRFDWSLSACAKVAFAHDAGPSQKPVIARFRPNARNPESIAIDAYAATSLRVSRNPLRSFVVRAAIAIAAKSLIVASYATVSASIRFIFRSSNWPGLWASILPNPKAALRRYSSSSKGPFCVVAQLGRTIRINRTIQCVVGESEVPKTARLAGQAVSLEQHRLRDDAAEKGGTAFADLRNASLRVPANRKLSCKRLDAGCFTDGEVRMLLGMDVPVAIFGDVCRDRAAQIIPVETLVLVI
ncbi:hypothetical protein FQR65_LT20147 [Abscondita terminalis]|nr:hypothetical protein FQR65_LT20147 [Abscondita terminalis]